jgi:hypothetical protein
LDVSPATIFILSFSIQNWETLNSELETPDGKKKVSTDISTPPDEIGRMAPMPTKSADITFEVPPCRSRLATAPTFAVFRTAAGFFAAGRGAASPSGGAATNSSQINLGDAERVFHFDSEISHGAPQLRVAEQGLHRSQVSRLFVDLGGLRSLHRMRAKTRVVETDASHPAMDDPSVLACRNVGLLKDATRKEKPPLPDFENGQPILDRRTSLLGEFELDRPARLFLDDRCAVRALQIDLRQFLRAETRNDGRPPAGGPYMRHHSPDERRQPYRSRRDSWPDFSSGDSK